MEWNVTGGFWNLSRFQHFVEGELQALMAEVSEKGKGTGKTTKSTMKETWNRDPWCNARISFGDTMFWFFWALFLSPHVPGEDFAADESVMKYRNKRFSLMPSINVWNWRHFFCVRSTLVVCWPNRSTQAIPTFKGLRHFNGCIGCLFDPKCCTR